MPAQTNNLFPFSFLYSQDQTSAAQGADMSGVGGSKGKGGGPSNIPPSAAMAAPMAQGAAGGAGAGGAGGGGAPTDTTSSFLTLNDVTIGARAAAVVDTTRMDPAAMGLFLPSAIPARGMPNFGLGERTTFQGNGSSAGLNWTADVPTVGQLNGGAKIELLDTTNGGVTASTTQAWLSWQNLLFGQTDSTLTDVMAVPETIDLGGPIGRAAFYKGTTEFRYTIWQPTNQKADPTGFYVNVAAENPGQDIFVPAGYQTFSRYPDFIATIKYESGVWEKDACTGTPYFDGWHVQLGGVVRDLGVEDSNTQKDILREETTGWGLQLSGSYTINRECNLFDFIYFNVIGGRGLARYLNDLNLVTPIYDASFTKATGDLNTLPLLGYFVAYQHDWNRYFRSTACYSHVDLDSDNQVVPAGTSPYRHGDYVLANLMFHYNACDPAKTASDSPTEHTFLAGIEYLYGHIEDLNGNRGQDQRVMIMVAATK